MPGDDARKVSWRKTMTILEVQDVSKDFGGLRALSNVSFSLKDGSILGLIGPNGSGKTTLFNVITGFLKPTSGRVIFCGEDITGNAPHRACKVGIARTFQLNKPFSNMTVQENVMVGLLNGREPAGSMGHAKAQCAAILAFTGLEQKCLTKSGTLGIVDRKRVELARALGASPKLLLLDEMMTGLNLREIEDVMELVREIRASGTTVIVVEHVMKAVLGISDKVIVLSAGKKIFEGTPREVINDQQVIEAYLGEYEHA
jgi:branched-chain amino acid transport system ATP-binding protein